MSQFGFFFDQSRCSGCHACAVACKNWNHLSPGPLKYLRIYEYEKGDFPDVRIHFQWIPCYHCQQPNCVASCPSQAIYKEAKYGAVLIDDTRCDGCRVCYEVCPYGAPVFAGDEPGIRAQKCTMCFDRLENDEQPLCVLACPLRALDFGPLTTLRARYGETSDLEDMPSSLSTKPAVVFKAHVQKRLLVPYDAARALGLFTKRQALSEVGASAMDSFNSLGVRVGRRGLVIKHRSVDELMRRTRNDEG